MKVATIGIYKITNPKGRIYIGQSNNIEYRFSKYRLSGGALKKQKRIYRSLQKYGWESHVFEIIHVCEKHQLNDLERYYIELYNTFNTDHGLNLTNGGEFFKFSTETKLLISEVSKKRSLEFRLKMSKAKKGNKNMLGKVHTEETKNKIRAAKTGLVMSEEVRKNMSQAQKKRGKRSEDFRKKMSLIGKGNTNWMNNPKFKGHPNYKAHE